MHHGALRKIYGRHGRRALRGNNATIKICHIFRNTWIPDAPGGLPVFYKVFSRHLGGTHERDIDGIRIAYPPVNVPVQHAHRI